MRLCAALLLVLFATSTMVFAFQSGVSFMVTNGVTFDSPGADQSLVQYVTQTNAKWIAIVTSWYQHDINSTVIAPDHTTSGQSIVHAIKHAKHQGLKVLVDFVLCLFVCPGPRSTLVNANKLSFICLRLC